MNGLGSAFEVAVGRARTGSPSSSSWPRWRCRWWSWRVVTGTVVRALRTQSRQTIQIASLSDTRLALERVTRDIRGADLKVAALDRIRLDVRGPGGAVDHTVTYERVGNHLLATDATTGVARELVDDLVPGPPLFLFHLVDGSTATGATRRRPVVGALHHRSACRWNQTARVGSSILRTVSACGTPSSERCDSTDPNAAACRW